MNARVRFVEAIQPMVERLARDLAKLFDEQTSRIRDRFQKRMRDELHVELAAALEIAAPKRRKRRAQRARAPSTPTRRDVIAQRAANARPAKLRKTPRLCGRCKQPGHNARSCDAGDPLEEPEPLPMPPPPPLPPPQTPPPAAVAGRIQRSLTCSACRQPGHSSRSCPTITGRERAAPIDRDRHDGSIESAMRKNAAKVYEQMRRVPRDTAVSVVERVAIENPCRNERCPVVEMHEAHDKPMRGHRICGACGAAGHRSDKCPNRAAAEAA